VLTPENIWNYKQNKPTLVVKDLECYAPADVIYFSLLTRGVFKWLSARRKIIRLKDDIKAKIVNSFQEQKESTSYGRKMYIKGYRKALEECRKEIREICHSPRWQAPDFDSQAQKYLDKLGNQIDNSNS
jgi:hypothetical protein